MYTFEVILFVFVLILYLYEAYIYFSTVDSTHVRL